MLAQLRATGPWRAILGDILAMPVEPALPSPDLSPRQVDNSRVSATGA